jgi:type I restriction enzyme S subunit
MKKYPKYKDSGVEWIGEIPEGWSITPLKHFANVALGKMLTSEDKGGQLLKPYLRSQNVQSEACDLSDVKEMWFSEKELEDLRVHKDDLLVNEGGDVGRTAIWTLNDFEVYIQNSINKVTILNGNPKYFFYHFQFHHKRGYFDGIVSRVSIPHLTKEKLSNIDFITPTIPEQQQIVTYLDQKTTLIDQIISGSEKKIELLKEQRTATINHAVTKGLNPKVKTKDSGVEWIGEIPSQWEKKRIRNIGVMYGGLTGKSGDDFRRDEDDPSNRPFIPFTNICNNTYINKTELKLVSINENDNQNRVQKHDLFFMMTSETQNDVGKTSVLREDLGEVYLNTFCKGFRITDQEVDPFFLNYLLNGKIYRELISVEGNGYTRINLRQDRVNEFIVLLPPLTEQQQIVTYLDQKTKEIDDLISSEQKRIELMKEYRQSLISEVVTGKIKITN